MSRFLSPDVLISFGVGFFEDEQKLNLKWPNLKLSATTKFGWNLAHEGCFPSVLGSNFGLQD